MGSYLDAYAAAGAQSARRGKLIKVIAITTLSIALVATISYYMFRNWSQERVVNQFLEALARKDYAGAYKLWGCTPETPCKDYSADKFNEDWGPASPYANSSEFKVQHVDYCDSGVVFNLVYPRQEEVGLWVDRSTNVIGFAPWARCPGRHLQFGEFFKTLFSKS